MPISRPWLLDKWEQNLTALQIPHEDTELIVHVDSPDKLFRDKVGEAMLRVAKAGGSFAHMRLLFSQRGSLEGATVLERRLRIIDIWNQSVNHFGDTDLVFSVEDDTICPPHAFSKFKRLIYTDGEVGFITGVEAHRTGNRPLGIWQVFNHHVYTLPYKRTGVDSIGGAGLYCFAARTELVKNLKFREDGPPFGPDVCFVNDVVAEGFKALVDWEMPCLHLQKEGIPIKPSDSEGIIGYRKTESGWEFYETDLVM